MSQATPMNPNDATLAGAFSSVVFRALGKPDWGQARARLSPLFQMMAGENSSTIADTFERAHELLCSRYRNEYVFKNELVSKIVFGKHSPRTASAILELPMGNSCADLMVLNGTTTTYEIKTDLDQFSRLSTQLSDYASRSEYVNVVTSDKRASAAEQHLPDFVGIMSVNKFGTLRTVRTSRSNRERLNVEHLFQLLRQHEALSVLRAQLNYEIDVPRGHLWTRSRELFLTLSQSQAHASVLGELRKRGKSARTLSASPTFPKSLRALAYTTEMSNVATQRVLERLKLPVSLVLEH